MEVNREAILDRTHYGLNIYSHVLRKYYPGETVLSLAGRGCDPAKNPFNDSKTTLWIRIIDGCACHIDTERAIENGDAFDFAALHFKAKGQELYELLNKELHLRIGEHHPFYDYNKGKPKVEPKPKQPKLQIPVFSYFKKPITNTKPTGHKSLLEVYEMIKGNRYQIITEKLRSIEDKKEARKYKAFQFDYVTFSGIFSSRSDKNLKAHSGLMVIDFDHLENTVELKERLLNDQYFETELLFVSPSGDGLKWIIPIDLSEGDHQYWFLAIANYLRQVYQVELDESGKDVSRACFLPHDADVVINPKYLGK
ncbi:BT4734/BF3469 family protein [Roseivirga seohaensis]|uniref:BT4734/BF3469 family protein n=1 Tax=Roseivirga seohaensis TaxID=1914963 RepID=UPI003BAA6216